MIQIITGEKGKGKTKILLDKVNTEIKDISGSAVYLDKSTKHMYELNNKVRLINVQDFFVDSPEGFLGFVCGIISQDNDLEKVYLDSFLKVAHLEDGDLKVVLDKLAKISETFNVDFVLSVSLDNSLLPAEYHDNVIAAL